MALVAKNPPANVGDIGDPGSIPGSERSPGEGNGYPLQCSCLKNPMDWGAWWATVHRVTKSWTRLKWQHVPRSKGVRKYKGGKGRILREYDLESLFPQNLHSHKMESLKPLTMSSCVWGPSWAHRPNQVLLLDSRRLGRPEQRVVQVKWVWYSCSGEACGQQYWGLGPL